MRRTASARLSTSMSVAPSRKSRPDTAPRSRRPRFRPARQLYVSRTRREVIKVDSRVDALGTSDARLLKSLARELRVSDHNVGEHQAPHLPRRIVTPVEARDSLHRFRAQLAKRQPEQEGVEASRRKQVVVHVEVAAT